MGQLFAGRYRLEERIGSGGMGTVYRAQHLYVGEPRALKLLRPEVGEDEDVRERFLTEPKQAAKTHHPNIIPVYDAGSEDDQAYIAMEYVEGEDLRALLEREGALAPERTLAIVRQVASALDAAHARGIVHRDVKPANILVSSGGHVYLTDFGIAKDAALAGRTRKDVFLGTIQYAAPEQIRRRDVDGRADVYALGCVLYHCLVGAPPFEHESEFDLMNAHVQEPPPRLTEARPELPPALDAVIARVLAKEPKERYASCMEFVDAAASALGEAPAVDELEAGGTVIGQSERKGTVIDKPEAGGTAIEEPEPLITTLEPRPRRRKVILASVAAAFLVAGSTIGALAATGAFSGRQASPNAQVPNAQPSPPSVPSAPTGLTLTPAAFSADPSTWGVTIQWEAPLASGPVDHYEILRDGMSIGVLSGTDFLDQKALPQKKYVYEVVAVGPGGRSDSLKGSLGTPSPPLSQARLQGTFKTTIKVASTVGSDYAVGDSYAETWIFKPSCKAGGCATRLRIKGYPQISVLLKRSGAKYAGNDTGAYGVDVPSTLGFTLTVRKARVIGGAWRVIRLKLTVDDFSPETTAYLATRIIWKGAGTLRRS